MLVDGPRFGEWTAALRTNVITYGAATGLSSDRSRTEVGPAFAHGCHDLGDLGVESVRPLGFGSARDEGLSIGQGTSTLS